MATRSGGRLITHVRCRNRMRDTHDHMPELIATINEGDQYFGIVRMERDGQVQDYRIGLHQDEYRAWRRVLTTRPFESLNTHACRYFFSPCTSRRAGKTFCHIRIEQDRRGKEFEMSLPERTIGNLMWFFELKSLSQAEHLRYEKKGTEPVAPPNRSQSRGR